MDSPRCFPFFRLPPEIRTEIIRTHLEPSPDEFYIVEPGEVMENRQFLPNYNSRNLVALLLTSRQMFQEAQPLASSHVFFRADQYGVGLFVRGKLHWDCLEHLTVMSFEGDLLDSDTPLGSTTRGSEQIKKIPDTRGLDKKYNMSPVIEVGRDEWYPWKACITSILEALSGCQNIQTIRFRGVRPCNWAKYFSHFLQDHPWTYPGPFGTLRRRIKVLYLPEHREHAADGSELSVAMAKGLESKFDSKAVLQNCSV